jgi:hypothetical protein
MKLKKSAKTIPTGWNLESIANSATNTRRIGKPDKETR